MRAAIFIMYVLAIVFTVMDQSEANYKKPLFNGSIFGKRGFRGENVIEYDTRVLSALCEITTDTCQAWFLTLENK